MVKNFASNLFSMVNYSCLELPGGQKVTSGSFPGGSICFEAPEKAVYENMQLMYPTLARATYLDPHPNLLPLRGFIQKEQTLGTGGAEAANWDDIHIFNEEPSLIHQHQEGMPLNWIYYAGKERFPSAPKVPTRKYPRFGFNEQQFLAAFTGLCSGLIHLEKYNIVHRDISLNNILITPDDRLVLMDYELACHQGNIDQIWKYNIHNINFCAPEQDQDYDYLDSLHLEEDKHLPQSVKDKILSNYQAPSFATDVFCMTGVFSDMYDREIRNDPEADPERIQELNLRLDPVFAKAFAYNAQDRQQSAAELLADITSVFSEEI